MLQLIRTITMIAGRNGIVVAHSNQVSPLHINVAILACDGELPDQLAHNVECMQRAANADASDCRTLAGGTINAIRRGMRVFMPNCGPGCEQSDPDVLWQRTFDGYDCDGVRWIVNYSVVRSI